MGLRTCFGSNLRASLNSVSSGQRSIFSEWVVFAISVTLAVILGTSVAKGVVHASIIVDAQTGAVLEAHNQNKPCYPASLTKLMTLYLVFQRLQSGELTLPQKLYVSGHAAAQSPTKLWLRAGSRISVKSAILAIVTRSANDAAVVLAEGVAGAEGRFALLMTHTARRLGMMHTTFRNASGLPNPYQRTTARDMATLALALIHDFPQYYHFFRVRSFVFHGRRIYGHDHLLGRFAGADGLKTGYIRASGYNLVTSAVRGGRRLVGVVMGGSSFRSRDRLMMAYLDRAFSPQPAKLLATRESIAKAPSGRIAHENSVVASVALKQADVTAGRHWAIQIGLNFNDPVHVRRTLASARRTVPALKRARALVVKLNGSPHHHYRARFSALNEHMALQDCRALRQRKFACTAFHIPSAKVMLASAGK